MSMNNDHPIPGQWPQLSRGAHDRLVALARARLVGRAHAAEDVVQESLIKWCSIDESKQDVARIEQVVKTVAASYRRSEERRVAREFQHAADRSRRPGTPAPDDDPLGVELGLATHALVSTARKKRVGVNQLDVIILGELLKGESIASVARSLNLNRYRVRRSRERWRLAARLAAFDSATASGPIELPPGHSVSKCGKLFGGER